jgi:hypothetical protein
VYAGLARLVRLLRNARGVDLSHSLSPVTIAGRSLAPIENTRTSSEQHSSHWEFGGIAQHGR